MIPYLLSTDYNQQIFRSSLTTFYPPIVAILTPIVPWNKRGWRAYFYSSHYSPAYNAQNEGEKGYHFSVRYGTGENMQAFAKLAQSQEEKYNDNKWAQTELHYVSGSPDESRMWRLKSPVKIKKRTEQHFDMRPEFSKTATMEINTDNCKIVIIDGQHRAMSMLALYRNYNPGMWDGSRGPFEIFYKEWNRKVVDKALMI